MFKRLKLYFLKRRIRFLEDQEVELQATLRHVQGTLLPNARSQYNNLTYGTTRFVRKGWSQS